jgi:hypothetical protein
MLKKALAAVVAAVLYVAATLAPIPAANVPILTGPQFSDASQILGSLNALVQSINTNVSGLIGASVVQAATTGTTIQTLGTVTIPGGTLANAGQAIRIKAFGTGTATGTNTLTVQVGTATAFAVAGAATTAGVFVADVLVLKTGANTQQIWSQGQFNATITTPTEQSGTLTDTGNINVTVSGTSTTTGNFTLNGVIVEQVK